MAMPVAKIMAIPTPWKTRKKIKDSADHDSPARKEVSAKITMPHSWTFLRP